MNKMKGVGLTRCGDEEGDVYELCRLGWHFCGLSFVKNGTEIQGRFCQIFSKFMSNSSLFFLIIKLN